MSPSRKYFDFVLELFQDFDDVIVDRKADLRVLSRRFEPFIIEGVDALYVLAPLNGPQHPNFQTVELLNRKEGKGRKSVRKWYKIDKISKAQIVLVALQAYELSEKLFLQDKPLLRHA